MVSTAPISMASRRIMSVMEISLRSVPWPWPAAQQHGDGFNQAARDPGQQPAPAGDSAQQVGFFAGDLHHGIDDPEKPGSGVGIGQGLIDGGIHLEPELPVQGREDQFFLVGEIPEQGGRAHAGGDGDGLQRHFGAVFAEALPGRGDDFVHVARGICAERPAVYCPVHLPRVATPGAE